jgi:Fe-S oxidoreductase
MYDFTTLLIDVAKLPDGSLSAVEPRTVAYHDSCQGLNALGLYDAPRAILGGLLGHDVRDLAEARVCCGFGGSFSFEYPEVSRRLMGNKLDDVEATGALEVVTDNQGCILQLRGGIDAEGRRLRVRHLAELVAEGVEAIAKGQPKSSSPDSE